jgi:hypothetical protein
VNRTAKAALVVALVLCAGSALVAYRHRHNIIRWVRQMQHALATRNNPPAAAPGTLEIGGQKFKDVLGYPPYYLAVTQFDAALFVTRVNNGGTNLFHIMNLKTGEEEQIKTRADFGRNIGAMDDAFRDYVVSAGPEEVVVASETWAGSRMKTVLHLNLRTAMVDTREVYYYDKNGRLTNTFQGPGF